MQKMSVEGEYETEFTILTLRIYTILAGCVGIPSPAYSAPFLHYITTLDGTITYFVALVCLVLFTVTSLLCSLIPFAFLVITTYHCIITLVYLLPLLILSMCLVPVLIIPLMSFPT